MIPTLQLRRFLVGRDVNESTLGALIQDNKIIAYTLELPWLNNSKEISCIMGIPYEVIPYSSPKFGACFHLNDVPNRTEILIHAGNTRSDTKGCILVGAQLGKLNGQDAVLNSRAKLDEMLQLFPEGFDLEIETIS